MSEAPLTTTSLESIRLVDKRLDPHPTPCPDCGRVHLVGEHVVYAVPAPQTPTGYRTVWQGCADCWVTRTNPEPDDTYALAFTAGRRSAVDDLRFLADAREQYGRKGHAPDWASEKIAREVETARNLARYVEGPASEAGGWLPSWTWDEWETRRAVDGAIQPDDTSH